jgi:ribosomal protein S18 acetylase RimI-like enzyme
VTEEHALHPQDAPHPLDNPAYAALTGPHAHLAERRGRVLRYQVDVSPWLALPADPGPDDWADVAALAGPGASVHIPGIPVTVPADWEVTRQLSGVQYVDDGLDAAFDDEARPLTAADVPQMLDLVARTEPGPFLPRSILLGDYLGVWRDGRLVAMAGERLHPPGWTEISAVCTDPEYRGQGLATRLIRAVAAGIRARGETPFLHAARQNTTARALYESLGFRLRRPAVFRTVRVPEHLPQARPVEAV